ncbi:MAG TPA: TRAP transporter large permease subunit [Azospirillaceae bacterium]|nr:TRAP transporter large permease subunit [Azospirillaceae bacterium]HRQ79572.1 TRAP transporter large permease subunit [Azospirillaceae bacterium]
MATAQIGLLYGAVTLVLLFSGMPIAFALGLSALGFMAVFMPPANLSGVAEVLFSELDNFTLLTIPLFVLMGAAIGKTRAGSDVYSALNAWMHRIPGGLGLANVFACSIFAAMCGSSPATCSAIGSSGIPQLIKRGYSEGLAAGLIAAGGRLGDVKAILSGAVRESTMIMMIIATSFLFTYVMSYLGITQAAAQWLVSLDLGKWQFIFWVCMFLIALGFFLPPVAIILMVTPIILPSLKALDVDLIWFGVVMTILMEMGLIHPPVGLNLFVISGIAPDIKLRNIIWGTMPFLGLMALGILLLCFIPEIAVWLPNHFYRGT